MDNNEYYTKYLESLKCTNGGVPITQDAFTCFMCGEETGEKPRRCMRCGGTLFELIPAMKKHSETDLLIGDKLKKSTGRPSREQKLIEQLGFSRLEDATVSE